MNIAICDDDEAERDIVRRYVSADMEEYTSLQFGINTYERGEDLLAACESGMSFDILFLDIHMGEIDGIRTAREIKKIHEHAIIFFITGYAQYVSDAFALEAFQYITKPIEEDVFHREFRRAIKKYLTAHQKYSFEDTLEGKHRTVTLEIKDIINIESIDHYVKIYTAENRYMKRGKLDDVEIALSPYGFVRTHKRYLVNMGYLSELTLAEAVLRNNERVHISARRRAHVMEAFNAYMAEFSL